MPNDWMQDLWDLICALYQMYGGNCADLPPRPKAAELAQFMWAVFNTKGPPNVSTPSTRIQFLSLMNQLESHLNLPANTLPADVTASFRALIAALRAAVGP